MSDQPRLSLRAAALRMGVHWKTVYALVRSGALPATRVGLSVFAPYRIDPADLEAFERSRRVVPTAPPVRPAPRPRGRMTPSRHRAGECQALGLDVEHEFR